MTSPFLFGRVGLEGRKTDELMERSDERGSRTMDKEKARTVTSRDKARVFIRGEKRKQTDCYRRDSMRSSQ